MQFPDNPKELLFITVSYKDISVFIQPATLYLAFVCLFHVDFLTLKDSIIYQIQVPQCTCTFSSVKTKPHKTACKYSQTVQFDDASVLFYFSSSFFIFHGPLSVHINRVSLCLKRNLRQSPYTVLHTSCESRTVS